MARYTNKVSVRLTPEELEFIDMVAKKTGKDRSEAIRLVIDMFMIALSGEAIDPSKFAREVKKIVDRGPLYVYIRDEDSQGA